ncbi:PREDICTED: uncharacterized protein LOC104719609 [Camelina sativa]|uniref:S-protein homolog n=1 Tax=Camelina sativa TaxID=90675 RepID=A0ABM0U4X7_CAMSA|nr:PREDICTED: uncharacterized protein LOC104719609 [Camelina sativa]
MNRLLCFLLFIGLCVGLSDAKFKWPKKSTVFVKSSLGQNNVLKIHCKSVDDDLGFHFLRTGETYDFSFYESFLITSFDCYLWQGPHYKFHAEFEAYAGGGIIIHSKKNFWDAREDGIYFTHGKEMPKLEYKWNYFFFFLKILLII